MARRTKVQDFALGFIIVLALIGWGIAALNNALGTATLVTLCVGVIVLIAWVNYSKRKARISYLMGKYGDPLIVDRIMQREIWQGQTSPQLLDARGMPVAKDDKLLKTIKREVWKYHPTGKNRYALRVTLDNDVVTGWDQKN